MARAPFADRLRLAVEEKGSPIVVGLDPRLELLPPGLRPAGGESIGNADAANRLLDFNRRLLDLVAPHVPCVKPQVAFYERYGAPGYAAYVETIREARSRGLIVIGDTKRNDIGSTAAAYAEGHLGAEDGADALTVNPYLGSDGVEPFLEVAEREGRGVFLLVKTSNPSSGQLQDLRAPDDPIYEHVARYVRERGAELTGECGDSLLGAVVGATYPEEAARLRGLMPLATILVPGYGAQGGGARDTLPSFRSDGTGAVVNSSRGIIHAYRMEGADESRWEEAVVAAVTDMRRDLAEALAEGAG
jgi:orotidine-5'-phosphate decarboxylase